MAEDNDDDQGDFEDLMMALEWYFHVTQCKKHSHEERVAAYMVAFRAFQDVRRRRGRGDLR